MCTVTFIPSADRLFLTSNRDEQAGRKTALAPAVYRQGGGALLYPRDSDAGGTWFALHEDGRAGVLLNGAWVRHAPQGPYRRSRGLVLLDLMTEPSPREAFDEMPLEGIEPFTLVALTAGALTECRWDGARKWMRDAEADVPHIWSSATLYDEHAVRKRERWFADFLAAHPAPGEKEILDFHRHAGGGDAFDSVRMNRGGRVGTVSITLASLSAGLASMDHADLRDGSQTRSSIRFKLPAGAAR